MANITNNPFNIRYSTKNNWQGQIGSYNGFCKFCSYDYGIRAGILLLRNYIVHGYNTPRKIIERYAPRTENFTDNYLSFVSTFLPLDDFVRFPSESFVSLCQAICKMESNYTLTRKRVYDLINYFRI